MTPCCVGDDFLGGSGGKTVAAPLICLGRSQLRVGVRPYPLAPKRKGVEGSPLGAYGAALNNSSFLLNPVIFSTRDLFKLVWFQTSQKEEFFIFLTNFGIIHENDAPELIK